MSGGGSVEGAYGPNNAQFEVPVGVEGVSDALIVAARELDPEEENLVEVLEDLGWGVVGDAVVKVFVGIDGEGGGGGRECGSGSGDRGRKAFGTQELVEGLNGFHDSVEDEAEEVLERASVGGGRRGGTVVVRDQVVDADNDIFDLRDEGVEAALALSRMREHKE
ncbi:hypothetical protein GYH30_018356 [Glycine max]|nr:hypothetical protein GYH30_018356 [Glycine max]